MNFFTKKFETLLESSLSYKELVKYTADVVARLDTMESRVVTAESQLSILTSTIGSLMEMCTNLGRGHIVNRKAIEEIFDFLSKSMIDTHDAPSIDHEATSNVTSDVANERKKILN